MPLLRKQDPQHSVRAHVVLLKTPEVALSHADQAMGLPITETVDADRIVRGVRVYKRFGETEDAMWLAQVCRAVDGAALAWDGPRKNATILLPAMLDKLLVNLSRLPRDADAFLRRVEFYVDAVHHVEGGRQHVDNVFADVIPLVALGDEEQAVAEQLGRSSDSALSLLETMLEWNEYKLRLADVIVTASLMPDTGRLGASTKMKPLKANNERIAELAFWALWDFCWLVVQGRPPVLKATVNAIRHQCEYYRSNGLPGLRDLGVAPYVAVSGIPFLRMMHGLELPAAS